MSDRASHLLTQTCRGDKTAADQLFPLLYEELRGLASRYLRHERPGHTLRPTDLVHETYLRLIPHRSVDPAARTAFLVMAASAMRRVLVDHARRRNARKRGGGHDRVALDLVDLEESDAIDSIELEDSLSRFTALDARAGRVAELRLFAGLSEAEAAEALGVSPRTVREDWRVAKAWLRSEMGTR